MKFPLIVIYEPDQTHEPEYWRKVALYLLGKTKSEYLEDNEGVMLWEEEVDFPDRFYPALVERKAKAQALRAKGKTYAQIAKALGVGIRAAWEYTNPDKTLVHNKRRYKRRKDAASNSRNI